MLRDFEPLRYKAEKVHKGFWLKAEEEKKDFEPQRRKGAKEHKENLNTT